MYAELQDKVVLITGAPGALGTVVTEYFWNAGARLVLADRHEKSLEQLSDDLDRSRLLLATNVDVTKRADVDWMVKEAVKTFGTIDVLINIVGAFRMGTPVHETPEDIWDMMMNVNAKSMFLVSSLVGKVMVDNGQGGRIISIGAKPGLSGGANSAAYSASKSAVLRVTESMAAELKGTGITVNAVIPSIIDTEANRKEMPNANFDKWVTPESLAGVIGFLASDAARDVTGALLPVYGRN